MCGVEVRIGGALMRGGALMCGGGELTRGGGALVRDAGAAGGGVLVRVDGEALAPSMGALRPIGTGLGPRMIPSLSTALGPRPFPRAAGSPLMTTPAGAGPTGTTVRSAGGTGRVRSPKVAAAPDGPPGTGFSGPEAGLPLPPLFTITVAGGVVGGRGGTQPRGGLITRG